MIGLDTNILVRYIAQDDPTQSAKAKAIVDRLTPRNPGFISTVALVETVWVLDRVYEFTVSDISAAIERMLQVETFVVENEAEVFIAFVAFRKGEAEFADALIAALGIRAGCSRTLTFDLKAARYAGFELAT